MKNHRLTLAAGLLLGSIAPAHSSEEIPEPGQAAANLTGLHDFDFFVGEWHVHHRRLKERLADSREWLEFDGTSSMRKLMDGWANVDDNVLDMPGGAYRGVSLSAYDPTTGQWAIWWLDGRDPFGDLDPPVKGRFKNGFGTIRVACASLWMAGPTWTTTC